MRKLIAACLAVAAVVLGGCEGVTTGTEVARVALTPAANGAYAPVKFNLAPGMNPVAVNFRADHSQDPSEFGKWNTYRAVLSKDGVVVVSRQFNVNHPGRRPDDSAPPPTQAVHTLFIVDVAGDGEHELTISLVSPAAITLRDPQVDVRSNVQRPPQ